MELLSWLIEKRNHELGDNCYHKAAMFQRFIDEVEELRKRTTWQPMETAPTDNAQILVKGIHGTAYIARRGFHAVTVSGRNYPTETFNGWMPLPEVE